MKWIVLVSVCVLFVSGCVALVTEKDGKRKVRSVIITEKETLMILDQGYTGQDT